MRCFLCVNHYTVHQPICSHPLFSSFPAWSHLECLSSCPTSAHCASFLTHTKKSHVQKRKISYFTDVCPALMRRCFIRTRSLHRNASISMLLEFVDSLVKLNGSDITSNVLFGLLESNKSTEYLVFFHKHRYNGCVCACQDPYVKPDQNITLWNYPLKLILYLFSLYLFSL